MSGIADVGISEYVEDQPRKQPTTNLIQNQMDAISLFNDLAQGFTLLAHEAKVGRESRG